MLCIFYFLLLPTLLCQEFTLDGIGPRGDDKARRIRFDKYGRMNITGIPFNYNLTANSNPLESKYQFQWNEDEKLWKRVSVEQLQKLGREKEFSIEYHSMQSVLTIHS